MRTKALCIIVIASLLVGACFAGCSMSSGGNSLFGNESSKESESYAEYLENINITVAGNLGTAESVKVEKISSDKEIYSKVRSLVYNDKVVYIELCYINLYDKSGNKVQQEGEASFQVKMSDTMKNAGGDTYDLYYYDSSNNKITDVESEVDGSTIYFKSNCIGFFVIVNVNNSGKPIVKPTEPVSEPSKESSGDSENKTKPSNEQPTTPAAVEPVVPATTPATQPAVQPTTPAAQQPTTSTPISAATTAGPNITKPAGTVSMPPASGNKEKPNLNINCSSKSNGNCRTFSITVTNRGNCTLRILTENATLYNPNLGSEYDRNLNLTDKNIVPKTYVDIEPGGAATVYFAVLGQATWYTAKSVLEFEMYYDGVKYLVTTGYAKGGTDYSVIG